MMIYTAALTLFLVLDPFGNAPVFLSVLKQVTPARRSRVLLRELLIALGILLVFFFFGNPIMRSFHLSTEALGIAGGFILLIIALKMIFPTPQGLYYAPEGDQEPLLVPMAVPFIAGPSSITTVLLFSTYPNLSVIGGLIAIFGSWGAALLILELAVSFQEKLNKRVLEATERLMGMILIVLAIQMLLDGLTIFVKTLQLG